MIGPSSGTTQTGSCQPVITTASPRKPTAKKRYCRPRLRVQPPSPDVASTCTTVGPSWLLSAQPMVSQATRSRSPLSTPAPVAHGPGSVRTPPTREASPMVPSKMRMSATRWPPWYGVMPVTPIFCCPGIAVRWPSGATYLVPSTYGIRGGGPHWAAGERDQQGEAGQGPHVKRTPAAAGRLTKHRRGARRGREIEQLQERRGADGVRAADRPDEGLRLAAVDRDPQQVTTPAGRRGLR